MFFAIFCCALLMLFAAPPRATAQDPCSGLNSVPSATPIGTATGCGVVITITGTTGHLVATVTGEEPRMGTPMMGPMMC